MSQFVQRLANYLANEIFIKGLANSRTFQRFVIRTDQALNEWKTKGTEHLDQTIRKMSTQAMEAEANAAANSARRAGPPQPPLRGFPGFVSAFVKEVQKDLGLGK